MKHGKNPNRDQKKLLTANKKNCEEWLLEKTFSDRYIFRHRVSGEELTLYKNSSRS